MPESRFPVVPVLVSLLLVLSGCGGGSTPAITDQLSAQTVNDTDVSGLRVASESVQTNTPVAQAPQYERIINSALDSTSDAADVEKDSVGPGFESGLQYKRIAMSDGVELEALVSIPREPGPHPLIVLPSSWALNFLEYLIPAKEWTDDGYVVISYTSRGFWLSGGLIDLAGPRTVKDLSEVIDWALNNTPSDPEQIGTGGSSYGGGIPALTAIHDNRIKAITAMSGFTDPITAIYVNQTISYQSVLFLDTLAQITGEFEPQIEALTETIKNGYVDPQSVDELQPPRSAILNIDALNRNKPAILQLSSWNDSLFLPQQHVEFFRAYRGEIAMELVAGDHITNDIGGWIGLPNINWERAKEWFDFHLKGGPAIGKKPLRWFTINTERLLQADNLNDMAPGKTVYTLSESDSFSLFSSNEDGTLSTVGGYAGWDTQIKGGVDTGANSGTLLITGAIQGATNVSPLAVISSFDRQGVAVWRAQSQDSLTTIAGSPRLDISVTPSRKDATIVAYLYDENAFGISSLVSHGVYTLRNVIPGQVHEVSFDLNAVAWDVAAGHSLVLVIDTDDARFTSETRSGDVVTLSGSTVQPSRLTLPVH